MAAFTPASSSSPRRSSSFLDGGDGADGAASAEWAAMSSAARVRYNDGPPSALEAAALVALRAALGDLCGAAPLKDQPENVSEFKLLRFLRGYAGDVAAAEAAYREMAAFRAAHGLDALRERLVANGGSAPHLWDEYQPIVACVSRGVRHQYGVDAYGNVLTMTDIGALDLRAIVKGGLQDLYVQFCMVTEEHGNLTLHELSEQAGKLIARHDVINVVNFGFFQWNKACYDLLGPIFEAGKHYPESVRKITSCGNGSVAVAAWQVMKNFIPERTKKKLRVLGTTFVPDLLTEVPLACIPLVWGGAGFGSAFDEAWTQKTARGGAPNTFTVGRRDSVDVKVGVPAGSTVFLAVSLQGYTLGMSTWFSSVERHRSSTAVGATAEAAGDRGGAGVGGEGKAAAKGEDDDSTAELVFDAVAPPRTIESAGGKVECKPWVAPTRGIFKVRFDNTFSMFRGKTVQVWLAVDDGSSGRCEEEEEEDEESEQVLF